MRRKYCPKCGAVHGGPGSMRRREGGETRERSLDKQKVPVVSYRDPETDPEYWFERWRREMWKET